MLNPNPKAAAAVRLMGTYPGVGTRTGGSMSAEVGAVSRNPEFKTTSGWRKAVAQREGR